MTRPIETARLTLRPYREGDEDALHRELYSDPEAMRFIGAGGARTLEEARSSVEFFLEHERRHGFSFWAVVERGSGHFLGDAGLIFAERGGGPEIEVGWRLGRAHWGRGYATEAGRAALDHAFDELGLERVLAIIQPANLASRRVAEKLAMELEGPSRYYEEETIQYAADRNRRRAAADG